ncbi:MAG TPA: hypothetical protein VFX61_22805 [Micromonosporaceae bacterium]|nr:hypothetical protein [Micromonosporaceae bacterium]
MTEVNGRAVFGTPKTHHRRSVPLPRFLVEPLAAQIAGRAGDELVFTSPAGEVLWKGVGPDLDAVRPGRRHPA